MQNNTRGLRTINRERYAAEQAQKQAEQHRERVATMHAAGARVLDRVATERLSALIQGDPWKVERDPFLCDCGMPAGYHTSDCAMTLTSR